MLCWSSTAACFPGTQFQKVDQACSSDHLIFMLWLKKALKTWNINSFAGRQFSISFFFCKSCNLNLVKKSDNPSLLSWTISYCFEKSIVPEIAKYQHTMATYHGELTHIKSWWCCMPSLGTSSLQSIHGSFCFGPTSSWAGIISRVATCVQCSFLHLSSSLGHSL